MEALNFIKPGASVYWNDPEGLTSGEYKVISVPDVIDEDSIILIADDYSEAEVFPSELTEIK